MVKWRMIRPNRIAHCSTGATVVKIVFDVQLARSVEVLLDSQAAVDYFKTVNRYGALVDSDGGSLIDDVAVSHCAHTRGTWQRFGAAR